MIVELVYSMTFWIHAFPTANGLSRTISPRELVTGVMLDASKHCVVPFGAYVQTHEEHDNTMSTRTIGAIALRPTGNAQGGHYFMSLETGRRINRNKWTEVPMPVDVIDRVNKMVKDTMNNRLLFGNRNNVEVEEEVTVDQSSDDESLEDSNSSSSDSDHVVGHGNGNHQLTSTNNDDHEDLTQDEAEEIQNNIVPDIEGEEPGEDDVHLAHNGDEGYDEDIDGQNEQAVSFENEENSVNVDVDHDLPGSDDTAGVSLDQEMDASYGPRSTRYNLRSRRKPRYDVATLLAQASQDVIAPRFDASRMYGLEPELEPLMNVVLTQYGVRKGLQVFKEKGDIAVRTEMQQLHDRTVMHPVPAATLTNDNRADALQYLMFLKEKRDGTLKGRGCADGRKQRKYIRKDEASSPTISTEAVFLILIIAAKEGRDVATMDIPGAFMQTGLDGEKIHIKFEGRMVELLAMIDPQLYRPHIILEKGKPVLYAELSKVLYGMLQASLKFWEQITKDLTGQGYTVNPYDWCVANKTVNGKQHTIGWHVDDFIMTHEDAAVNDSLISWFHSKYGKLSPLTVHRGHLHDYLGMTIDFSSKGKVVITMNDYIKRLLDEAPEDFSGEAATPAGKHLFDTDEGSTKLEKDRAAVFHHLVARSVFLCKRARPDIQLAVGFLTTRVKSPDQHDWKKLRRMLQYLRSTADLQLTLEADNSNVVKWWVDAAFAVHHDMKSQSGGAMSLGKGVAYGSSIRQKLNTKSSTEAELVATNDFMPQILWTRHFLEAQGYKIEENVVYQDNQSAILLEKNGKGSSSKRTRHINIRYFFITDRIASKELSVAYCPTAEMVGDFFTKPLQGAQFQKFRNTVLNIK